METDFRVNYPLLGRLQLTDEHRRSLSRGGFVAEEQRGSGTRVFKLRFRCNGRQQVRYLGASPELAQQARQELARLQKDLQDERTLRSWARVAMAAMREAKKASEPLLQQLGFAFHGFEIRRPHETNVRIKRAQRKF